MILSDQDIRQELQEKRIIIEPITEESFQPASYDLHLGRGFITTKEVDVDELTILPQQFVLATTEEWISLDRQTTAMVEGRSSIGRKGLFIQNAGWIDPGFNGNITLELYNAGHESITIKPGMRICQLVFSKTRTPAEFGYEGKYLGQTGVTKSRWEEDE